MNEFLLSILIWASLGFVGWLLVSVYHYFEDDDAISVTLSGIVYVLGGGALIFAIAVVYLISKNWNRELLCIERKERQ